MLALLQLRQLRMRRLAPLARELARNADFFFFQRRNKLFITQFLENAACADAVQDTTEEYVRRAAVRRVREKICAAVEHDTDGESAAARAIAFAGSRWGMLQRDVRTEVQSAPAARARGTQLRGPKSGTGGDHGDAWSSSSGSVGQLEDEV